MLTSISKLFLSSISSLPLQATIKRNTNSRIWKANRLWARWEDLLMKIFADQEWIKGDNKCFGICAPYGLRPPRTIRLNHQVTCLYQSFGCISMHMVCWVCTRTGLHCPLVVDVHLRPNEVVAYYFCPSVNYNVIKGKRPLHKKKKSVCTVCVPVGLKSLQG